jgi:hypothetical protein
MKITINLPDEICERASCFAKEHNISFNDLVVSALQKVIQHSEASRNALARLKQGYDLGGNPPLSREEAHSR